MHVAKLNCSICDSKSVCGQIGSYHYCHSCLWAFHDRLRLNDMWQTPVMYWVLGAMGEPVYEGIRHGCIGIEWDKACKARRYRVVWIPRKPGSVSVMTAVPVFDRAEKIIDS